MAVLQQCSSLSNSPNEHVLAYTILNPRFTPLKHVRKGTRRPTIPLLDVIGAQATSRVARINWRTQELPHGLRTSRHWNASVSVMKQLGGHNLKAESR